MLINSVLINQMRREQLHRVARQAREPGRIADVGPRVTPTALPGGAFARANGRYYDQSGQPIWGFDFRWNNDGTWGG